MTKRRTSDDRSVRIGGNASNVIVQTGDGNTAKVTVRKVTLPPPEDVDIHREIAAIRGVLERLEGADGRRARGAADDAEAEVADAEPARDEVGLALERALTYARKTAAFAAMADDLAPHVVRVVSWLGAGWQKLLGTVGLVL